ncbi:MAG: MBL fold metallo-hydrolase [Ignavibacteriales bacterium]|nr:MBL fold metallo-hydrolase [Ignavibacteriales bacterium]
MKIFVTKKRLLLFSFLVVVLFGGWKYCTVISKNEDSKKVKTNNSKNFREGKFRNAVEWQQPSLLKNISIIWDFVFKGKNRKPGFELPKDSVNYVLFNSDSSHHLSVNWLGHSSLMINIDGTKILTDPVYEKKVSFFGPTRINGESPVNIAQLGEIDIVIISHNHYDHLNEYSIKQIHKKVRRFFVPLGAAPLLIEWGVDSVKIQEFDWWDEVQVSEHLLIAATPAQHFSGRGLFDRDETLWSSWVIKSKNHKIFFSGDSGYFDGFKKIGEKYGPFDMTFIECGAYNEQWHHIHMYPEETVQAHIDLKGEVLHPIHWGTFDLSMHAWDEPMKRASKEAAMRNVSLATPVVGGNTIFANKLTSNHWWSK